MGDIVQRIADFIKFIVETIKDLVRAVSGKNPPIENTSTTEPESAN